MEVDLRAWGLDAYETAVQRELDRAGLGRVVRVDRGESDVVTADGVTRVLSDSQRAQDLVAPVTGDWVQLGEADGLGTVMTRIHPRFTKVSRRDPAERDEEQVLAANVDVVAVVHGLDRPLPPGRLERLLVIALDSGATPIVVLTKADLADPDDPVESIVRCVAESVAVITTSTTDGSGFDALQALLPAAHTMALVGASGVGKSSLINALCDHELLAVGDVRSRDAKGRHTTTARELVMVPGGGLVLDTPGIRAVGLWEAEHALDRLFGDLVDLTEQCRFRDCSHREEPGCALTGAVAEREVDAVRVERFRGLTDELAEQARREESRARSKNAGRSRRRRR